MLIGLSDLRERLWACLREDAATLAQVSLAMLGHEPVDEDEWAEVLDFASMEWVFEDGRTLPERQGIPDAERLSAAVRSGLFVVDGCEGGALLLRDLANDAEFAVDWLPEAGPPPLRRTVLKARIVPWRESAAFFGDPGVYGEMGVIARQTLLEAWRATPEPALVAEAAEKRSQWRRMRAQRASFVRHFGSDLVVFPDADRMESALQAFLDEFLFNSPSSEGRTRADVFRGAHGSAPQRVELRIGESLRPGRPALLFHEVEGALFLPAFGELQDHLAGAASHPEVAELWLTQHDLPLLGLEHAGSPRRIVAPGGAETHSFAALFPGRSPGGAGHRPSLLPEFES